MSGSLIEGTGFQVEEVTLTAAELPSHGWATSKVLASATELSSRLAIFTAQGSVGELLKLGIAHGIREDANPGNGKGHESMAWSEMLIGRRRAPLGIPVA